LKHFACPHCGNRIYFENGRCLFCGSDVLYDAPAERFVLEHLPARWTPALRGKSGQEEAGTDSTEAETAPEGGGRRFACANAPECGCNWAAEAEGAFCRACRLNRTIPDLSVEGNRARWAEVEAAKRHLVYQLLSFGLAVEPKPDPDSEEGIAFDFLQDPPEGGGPRVLTGHDNGLITLNIAEADPVRRERMRLQMGEPYRTLLGHFRHEIGHYYWDRLLRDNPPWLERFRLLFGDERQDYGEALQRNYRDGPPPDWGTRHISAYAASHPWEDWAETWAHYLHIADLLEMAEALGLDPQKLDTAAARQGRDAPAFEAPFAALMRRWASLREAANALNRCMGLPDLYPFVISPTIAEKLRFVHELLGQARSSAEAEA
jgi:hypothetical protein